MSDVREPVAPSTIRRVGRALTSNAGGAKKGNRGDPSAGAAGTLASGPLRGAARAASRLGDLARTQATGAHVHAHGGRADQGAHALDVRVPTSLGATVRVRDVHAEGRLLAADFAD